MANEDENAIHAVHVPARKEVAILKNGTIIHRYEGIMMFAAVVVIFSHLDKLHGFKCELSGDSGWAAEQNVPQIMNLSCSLGNKGELWVLYEPHRWPVICLKMSLAHELPISMAECPGWHVGCCCQDFILDSNKPPSDGLA